MPNPASLAHTVGSGTNIRANAKTTLPTTTSARTNMITAAPNPAPYRVLTAITGIQGHYNGNGGPSTDQRQGAINRNGWNNRGRDSPRPENIQLGPEIDPSIKVGKYLALAHLSDTEAAAITF